MDLSTVPAWVWVVLVVVAIIVVPLKLKVLKAIMSRRPQPPDEE